MDTLTIVTILIIISAAFSYLNDRFVKMPGTIGVVTIAVAVSIVLLLAGKASTAVAGTIQAVAHRIDFSKVLLDVMLGLLLFASALHFDYRKLKEQGLPVFILSTLGVAISASVFGGLLYFTAKLFSWYIPPDYCFLFGALISPTDPIAVGAILKKSSIPPRIRTIISGESLFNDGVGLVLFLVMDNITDPSQINYSLAQIVTLFIREVLGGISIGLVIGFLGYRLMKSVTDYQTILLLSIALVLGISVIASDLHTSIPLAAVTAGLLIGSRNRDKTDAAKKFLTRIWQLIDEVLNTILFVMIGLQLVMMPFLHNYLLIGCLSVAIILIARLVSISLPAIVLLKELKPGNLFILTWAGLRGGISVAMALSLPNSPYRETIVSACYCIVIFSIIVQGLTLGKLVERIAGKK